MADKQININIQVSQKGVKPVATSLKSILTIIDKINKSVTVLKGALNSLDKIKINSLNSQFSNLNTNIKETAKSVKNNKKNFSGLKTVIDSVSKANLRPLNTSIMNINNSVQTLNSSLRRANSNFKQIAVNGRSLARINRSVVPVTTTYEKIPNNNYQQLSAPLKQLSAPLKQLSAPLKQLNSSLGIATKSFSNFGYTGKKSLKLLNAPIDKTGNSIRKIIDLFKRMKNAISKLSMANTSITKMGTKTSKLGGHVRKTSDSLRRFHSILIGIMGVAFVRRIQEYTDSWVNLVNSVKLGVKEFYNISPVMERVFDIAQRSRTELEPISKLFRRMSLASDVLGASYSEMLRVTETITKAIKISGSTTQEAARAIEQLAQAFSEGVIKAKDFRSIISQAPRVVQALADELTNGNIALLKTMLSTEQISIQQIFQALIAQSGKIDSEFGKLVKTIGEGWTTLENSARKYVGELAQASGFTEAFYDIMKKLANSMETVADIAISLAAGAIAGLIATFSGFIVPATIVASLGVAFLKLYRRSEKFKGMIDGTIETVSKFTKKLKEAYDYYTKTEDGIKKVNKALLLIKKTLVSVASIIGGILAYKLYLKIPIITKTVWALVKSTKVLKMAMIALKFTIRNSFVLLPIIALGALITKMIIDSKMFRDKIVSIGKAFKEWDNTSTSPLVTGLNKVYEVAKNVWNMFNNMSGDEIFIRFKYAFKQIALYAEGMGKSIAPFLTSPFEVVFDDLTASFKYNLDKMEYDAKDFYRTIKSYVTFSDKPIALPAPKKPENVLIDEYLEAMNVISKINKKNEYDGSSKMTHAFVNQTVEGGGNLEQIFDKLLVMSGRLDKTDISKHLQSIVKDLSDKTPKLYSKFVANFKESIKDGNTDIEKIFTSSMLNIFGRGDIFNEAGFTYNKVMKPWEKKIAKLGSERDAIIKGLPNPVAPAWEYTGSKEAAKKAKEQIHYITGFMANPKSFSIGDRLLQDFNLEGNITELQKLNSEIKMMNELLNTSNSVFTEFSSGMKSGLDKMVDEWSNMTASISTFTMNTFDKMGDALWNFFSTGKTGWKDLARAALQELNKIMFHKLMGTMLGFLDFGNSNIGGGSLLPAGFGSDTLKVGDYTPKLGMATSEASSGRATLLGSNAPGASLPKMASNQSKQSNNTPDVNITNVNTFDSESAANAMMSTPAGQQIIINTIAQNRDKVGIR